MQLPVNKKTNDELKALLKGAPKDKNEFIYEKFSDAKKKIEDVYISIAFRNSDEGQSLIKTVLETIQK